MNCKYRAKWWDMVLYTLNDHEYEITSGGEYNDLVDSLDIASYKTKSPRKAGSAFH